MPADANRTDPLVSVILPTHNRPHRVGQALDSVLSQTHSKIEVLVLDDGSDVAADEVIARVSNGDPRVRFNRTSISIGPAATRNIGIREAEGEFIAFIDDDDQWESTKLARQIRFFEDHPSTGIVSCFASLVIEGRAGHIAVHRRPERCSPELILWANCVGGFSSVMVRPSKLGDVLQIDESFPSVEDWDLWLRCARVAPVGVVPAPLVRYVSHSDPQLSDVAANRPGHLAFLEKHQATMPPACRSFHRANLRMEQGDGWRKRVLVVRSLATKSPVASALLLIEQIARLWGRIKQDPGLTDRTLARVINSQTARTCWEVSHGHRD